MGEGGGRSPGIAGQPAVILYLLTTQVNIGIRNRSSITCIRMLLLTIKAGCNQNTD